MKIYNETSSVVKINVKESEKLWLKKAAQQRCKQSSEAFNMCHSDLQEIMC